MKVSTLEEQRKNSNVSNDQTLRELAEIKDQLTSARMQLNNLSRERDKLKGELENENSPGAQALVIASSLKKRLDDLENKSDPTDMQDIHSDEVELESIRADLTQMKQALEARKSEDNQTREQIADLIAELKRLSDLQDRETRHSPLPERGHDRNSAVINVAILAASEFNGHLLPEDGLASFISEFLRQKGLQTEAEFQNPEFIHRNLQALINGDGNCLRKIKQKQRHWNYFLVVKVSGTQSTVPFPGTTAFDLLADSKLYSDKGKLISLRSSSETGAGFSEVDARESAMRKVSQVLGDFVGVSIQ
jgi:hypothetical protein